MGNDVHQEGEGEERGRDADGDGGGARARAIVARRVPMQPGSSGGDRARGRRGEEERLEQPEERRRRRDVDGGAERSRRQCSRTQPQHRSGRPTGTGTRTSSVRYGADAPPLRVPVPPPPPPMPRPPSSASASVGGGENRPFDASEPRRASGERAPLVPAGVASTGGGTYSSEPSCWRISVDEFALPSASHCSVLRQWDDRRERPPPSEPREIDAKVAAIPRGEFTSRGVVQYRSDARRRARARAQMASAPPAAAASARPQPPKASDRPRRGLGGAARVGVDGAMEGDERQCECGAGAMHADEALEAAAEREPQVLGEPKVLDEAVLQHEGAAQLVEGVQLLLRGEERRARRAAPREGGPRRRALGRRRSDGGLCARREQQHEA